MNNDSSKTCALLTVRAILAARHRTLGNGILQSGASIGASLMPLYIQAGDALKFSWGFPFWSIGVAGLLPVVLLTVLAHLLASHWLGRQARSARTLGD